MRIRCKGVYYCIIYILICVVVSFFYYTNVNMFFLDKCLAEILNPFYCVLSAQCLHHIMAIENESHGYHLTHK